MNPPRKAAIIDFMEWCRRNTYIESFVLLNKGEFMSLVQRYELAKGVEAITDPDSHLRMKWESAFDNFLKNHSSDAEALSEYPDF